MWKLQNSGEKFLQKEKIFLRFFLEILPAVTKNLKALSFFPKAHGQICHRQIPLCGTRGLFESAKSVSSVQDESVDYLKSTIFLDWLKSPASIL
jgi:hypothetical protein